MNSPKVVSLGCITLFLPKIFNFFVIWIQSLINWEGSTGSQALISSRDQLKRKTQLLATMNCNSRMSYNTEKCAYSKMLVPIKECHKSARQHKSSLEMWIAIPSSCHTLLSCRENIEEPWQQYTQHKVIIMTKNPQKHLSSLHSKVFS